MVAMSRVLSGRVPETKLASTLHYIGLVLLGLTSILSLRATCHDSSSPQVPSDIMVAMLRVLGGWVPETKLASTLHYLHGAHRLC